MPSSDICVWPNERSDSLSLVRHARRQLTRQTGWTKAPQHRVASIPSPIYPIGIGKGVELVPSLSWLLFQGALITPCRAVSLFPKHCCVFFKCIILYTYTLHSIVTHTIGSFFFMSFVYIVSKPPLMRIIFNPFDHCSSFARVSGRPDVSIQFKLKKIKLVCYHPEKFRTIFISFRETSPLLSWQLMYFFFFFTRNVTMFLGSFIFLFVFISWILFLESSTLSFIAKYVGLMVSAGRFVRLIIFPRWSKRAVIPDSSAYGPTYIHLRAPSNHGANTPGANLCNLYSFPVRQELKRRSLDLASFFATSLTYLPLEYFAFNFASLILLEHDPIVIMIALPYYIGDEKDQLIQNNVEALKFFNSFQHDSINDTNC